MPAYNPGGYEGTSDQSIAGRDFERSDRDFDFGGVINRTLDSANKAVNTYGNYVDTVNRAKALVSPEANQASFVTGDSATKPPADGALNFGGIDLSLVLIIGGGLFLLARVLD